MVRVRTHANPLSITKRLANIDYAKIFPDFTGKLDLEIGFGRGIFFRHWVQNNPDRLVIGVEVRRSIVDILQKKLNQDKISNAYLIHSTAQICLEDIVQDNSLEKIFIFHPDPWLKNSHHKRRVVNDEFLDLCSVKLKDKGKIYIATDVFDIFNDIKIKFKSSKKFDEVKDDVFWTKTYKTHWDIFSKNTNRERFFITYEIKEK